MKLGEWQDRIDSKVYYAESDGLVVAQCSNWMSTSSVSVYTDEHNPPKKRYVQQSPRFHCASIQVYIKAGHFYMIEVNGLKGFHSALIEQFAPFEN